MGSFSSDSPTVPSDLAMMYSRLGLQLGANLILGHGINCYPVIRLEKYPQLCTLLSLCNQVKGKYPQLCTLLSFYNQVKGKYPQLCTLLSFCNQVKGKYPQSCTLLFFCNQVKGKYTQVCTLLSFCNQVKRKEIYPIMYTPILLQSDQEGC